MKDKPGGRVMNDKRGGPFVKLMRYYALAFSVFVREPVSRALGGAALAVLLVGTVFYHFVEDWSLIDSFYFSTITLATIGFGDFVPTSEASRVFTVVYVILGLGIMAAFLSVLVRAPLMRNGGSPMQQSLRADSRRAPRRRYRRPRTTRRVARTRR